MPTYQYACTACGEQLEVVQSFTDAALTECPSCSGTLRKVFSAVGVVFKGSGFYKTDSRSSTSAEKSEKSEKKTTESVKSDTAAPKADSASKGDSAAKPSTPAKTSSTPAA